MDAPAGRRTSGLSAGHGIVPHGYNVVMQGDINRIIEMSDNERRKIIDEIAGVAEFDSKKDMALSELSQVRERMTEESVHIGGFRVSGYLVGETEGNRLFPIGIAG